MTAPSMRPPCERPSWLLSSGSALKMRLRMTATENSTPTRMPTTTIVVTSNALTMWLLRELVMLDMSSMLVITELACLSLLEFRHVRTGTQAARAGRARATHRGDGSRDRRERGVGRGHDPSARGTHRVQPAGALQSL